MRGIVLTSRLGRRVAMCALVAAAVLVPAEGIHAQIPTVRAYLDPPEIAGSEQPIQLILEFAGVKDPESVSVPVDLGLGEPDGFPRRGVMISARDTGEPQQGEVFTVRYTIFADLGPGSHRIGPLRVTADGHALETAPLTLLVAGTEGTSVRTRVDPPQVKVGDNFELIVEVLGGGRMTHFPQVPDVFDFAEYSGSGGGSDDSYSFTMLATTPGEFLIPPIPVRLGDRVLETEPLALVITDEPVDVSVQAKILSRSIWVGGEFVVSVGVDGVSELDEEPVLPDTGPFAELVELSPALERARFTVSGSRSVERNVSLRALVAGRFEIDPIQVMADGRTYMTDPISLVVSELPVGEAEPPDDLHFMATPDRRRDAGSVYVGGPSAFVDGRSYSALPLRRVALLPVGDGDLVIRPATVEVQLPASERPFGHRPPEWPIYTSFALTSDTVALKVLPLPEAGRPESFRGHVGTLEITSWVDRTSMAPGDTLTLQVEVDVEGYMRGLPEPEIEFPTAFEVLTPRTRNAIPQSSDGLSGMRTYIYRLVAMEEGAWEVPAVEMSYFDPEAAEYGVSRGQPFAVTVVPAGEEAR